MRIEYFVRTIRCTNCQALNDHTAQNCRWRTECANCAKPHHTLDCTESRIRCINCVRENYQLKDHKASDPQCLFYQDMKREKLQEYYKGRSKSQDLITNHNFSTEQSTLLSGTHPSNLIRNSNAGIRIFKNSNRWSTQRQKVNPSHYS